MTRRRRASSSSRRSGGASGTSWAIGITIVALILGAIATSGFSKNPFTGGPLASTQYAPPTVPNVGAGAYCTGTSTTYTYPFGSGLPSNCQNVAQTLQINVQAWNPGTNSPMGSLFKAANTVTCKIFQLQGSAWVNTESLQAASTGICTSGSTYYPGAQIIVQFCENSGTCDLSTSTYSTTGTVMYCPLPSLLGSGLCGSGPGAGFVPLWTPSGSTTIQNTYYMPVLANPGDQYRGMNAANKQQMRWTFQNGTSTTSTGAVCYMKTNVAGNCAAPTSSQGKWSASMIIQPFGTFPAVPYAFGNAQFSQVDPGLQTGATARGTLVYGLVVEIKATTNNDMCNVQNGGVVTFSALGGSNPPAPATVTPTIISRGGSATDQVYLYTIPDALVTRAADASGNVILPGTILAVFTFDCTQVYNGSGDVVAIAATQWEDLSIKYSATYVCNSINPEAFQVGGGADAVSAFGTVTNGLQIKT